MSAGHSKSADPRLLAAKTLGDLLQNRGSLSSLLPAYTEEVQPRDRALIFELCYGVMRFYPRLSAMVKQLLKKPLKAKDSDIQALLLIGCYQLSYMRVPDHAAISETVAATRLLNKQWAKALVNGVLRSYQRGHAELEKKLSEAETLSHPAWLLDKIRQQWPGQLDAIVAANNTPGPMTLRVNRQQQSRDAYLVRLREFCLDAHPCSFSADGIQLAKACDVTLLPDFDQGACPGRRRTAGCAPFASSARQSNTRQLLRARRQNWAPT